MKKQITYLALSAFLGLGVAMAQDQSAAQNGSAEQSGQHVERHQMDPNREVQRLGKELKLTQDQKNQILPVLTERQQTMQGIRSDNSLSQTDRRAKMQQAFEDSNNKIRAVLNDQQKQKYDAMQQQRRERMQQHRQEQQQNPGPSGQ